MRIAHISATFPPYMGGTGSVCYHNAFELARRGHRVTVFTAAYPPGEFTYPKEIEVCRLSVAMRFGNAPILPGLLRIRDFDILHLHYPFYFGSPLVALTAHRQHIPLVVTYHQDVMLSGIPGLVAKLHDLTAGNSTLRYARQVLFTTLDYGKASRARWLFAKNGVAALPNGVDATRFRPNLPGNAVRARHNISPDEVVFILVAGLDRAHYFKGVETFLQAAALLSDLRIRVMIVGDGDLRASYEQKAVELGIAERVIFTGRVSDEELPLHYVAADVGVLPSETMGEAFGVVLLEAMACGKPVIASNLPGVRTVVSEGQDGFLFQPCDAAWLAEKMRNLYSDQTLRLKWGLRGREKVESQYSWLMIGKRLEDVYRSVLSKNEAVEGRK